MSVEIVSSNAQLYKKAH